MRLLDMVTEDLHHVLDILKNDAKLLAAGEHGHVGKIELVPDWEAQLPRIIHRYEKEITRVYNSFNDPEGSDDAAWIEAHLLATKNFLIKHGLAEMADDEAVV